MSRSRRKIPIFKNTKSESDKPDRSSGNRRYRSRIKQALREGKYDELPDLREIDGPWAWDGDGKHYWADAKEKDMRK